MIKPMSQPTVEQCLQVVLQFQSAGRVTEARQLCQQILVQVPNHPAAMHMLGAIETQLGNYSQAAELLRKVVPLQPQNPGVQTSLGIALAGCGQDDQAIASYQKAIALDPNYARAHCNLGVARASKNQFRDAAATLGRALQLQPNYAEALCNLGFVLAEVGQTDQAITSLQRALQFRPNYPEAHYNLGNAFTLTKQLGPAVESFQRAIKARPNYAKAMGNLANVLSNLGRLDESIAMYRQTMAINPADAQIHSSLILTLHYHENYPAAAIREELDQWNKKHAAPLAASIRVHENDRNPDRVLRVGYVSPDFCRHSVSRFMLPVLRNHDLTKFEIVYYASVGKPDDVTEKLRAGAKTWRDVSGMSDEALADQVRADRIDVLVDLALHAAKNRLLAFARKPAPVQMTYLAYCGSSGIPAIDYRLTDPYFDPLGADESVHSEKSLRLTSYWCYEPTGDEPAVGPLPASTNGFITFGCLNTFAKANRPTLAAWAKLLQSIPKSRLILHAPAPDHSPHLREIFGQAGIDPSRVTYSPMLATREYFAQYNQIDIALDPLPFGGGTTSCDAIWMGAPVVSCTGGTSVSRAGSSILNNIGMPELVGKNVEQYLQIASGLANGLPRLAKLRESLRETMQKSPLMDAARFTRDLENLYRTAWRSWCA